MVAQLDECLFQGYDKVGVMTWTSAMAMAMACEDGRVTFWTFWTE